MKFKKFLEEPFWADELRSAGGQIDPDGSVLLYHATTKEIAALMIASQVMMTAPGAPDSYGIYLSSSPEVSSSYGDGTVVPVRVKAQDLNPDDVFPGRRLDFQVNTVRGKYRPIAIGPKALKSS